MGELSIDDVMKRRFDIVETVAIISGKHQAELAPFNEELKLCEQFIKDEMNKAGLQQVKTRAGMAFFQTKDSVTVSDFDATLGYIVENKAFHLLNRAVNKTSVKEYIQEHSAPPPGVEYSSFKDLAWRRGKG
jgi:hypothetical protein